MNMVVVTLLLSLIIISIPINCNGKDMLTSPPSQRQITPFKEIISYEVFHHAVKFICALSSSTKNVVTIQLSFPLSI